MVEIVKQKLDKADRRILAELDINCRIHSSKLAKIVRKSRQSVEYRIKQLEDKGIITRFTATINSHKLGRQDYKVYLRLRNDPKLKAELLRELRSSELVYWMAECSGSWDLVFSVICRDNQEFFDFKNNISAKFKDIILEERGDELIDARHYPKNYFTNETHDSILFGGKIEDNELEDIDYKLIEQLVSNANSPIVDLAYNLRTTPMIIKTRMKKLEKLGIILQYRIDIDLNTLGLEAYKAIITLDKYDKVDERKLINFISQMPNTYFFVRDVWKLELDLVVNNYQEYCQIIEKLKTEFYGIIGNVESVLLKTDEPMPGAKNIVKLKKLKTKGE